MPRQLECANPTGEDKQANDEEDLEDGEPKLSLAKVFHTEDVLLGQLGHIEQKKKRCQPTMTMQLATNSAHQTPLLIVSFQ